MVFRLEEILEKILVHKEILEKDSCSCGKILKNHIYYIFLVLTNSWKSDELAMYAPYQYTKIWKWITTSITRACKSNSNIVKFPVGIPNSSTSCLPHPLFMFSPSWPYHLSDPFSSLCFSLFLFTLFFLLPPSNVWFPLRLFPLIFY